MQKRWVKILSQLRIADLVDTNGVVDYVFERQNEDGGYTFCRGTASNAQDTYYALGILEMLGVKPKNTERTTGFLQGLQHEDGGFVSVKVAFYVIKSLSQLGSRPIKPVYPLMCFFGIILRGLEHPSTYVEVVSEYENLQLAVDLVHSLNFRVDEKKTAGQILSLQNSDGSFGISRHSRIASTYHALKILKILNHDDKTPRETLGWIRRCELPSGGFVSSPDASTGYLEETYYGVKALEVLGETLSHPKETLKYVARFQNPNGGFRRSQFLGISDLESTFHALSCIKTITSPLKRQ